MCVCMFHCASFGELSQRQHFTVVFEHAQFTDTQIPLIIVDSDSLIINDNEEINNNKNESKCT